MSIIGIDAGCTRIKIIEVDSEKNIKQKMILTNHTIIEAVEIFLKEKNIEKNQISKFVITGVGTDKINEDIYGIETIKVDEFNATANGALYLADKKEALVVSAGTGTALIMANANGNSHIGGTGLGGGALFNLCKTFAQINEFEDIQNCLEKGNIRNVDLVIEDVTKNEIKTLPKDITAANLGKLNENLSKEDVVIGLVNMIVESIGMMAIFATKNTNIRDIIIIGGITQISNVKRFLSNIQKLYNVNFIIPEQAEFATVLGAVKLI